MIDKAGEFHSSAGFGFFWRRRNSRLRNFCRQSAQGEAAGRDGKEPLPYYISNFLRNSRLGSGSKKPPAAWPAETGGI